jgi:hypothetical protein
MVNDIVRKWENKRFVFGQNIKGDVFGKCKDCEQTCVTRKFYEKGKIIYDIVCVKCKKNVRF